MKGLQPKVQGIRVPFYVFACTLLAMWLISGIHVGLIIGLKTIRTDDWLMTGIVLLYWTAVSIAFTACTRSQMRKYCVRPIKRIADAAQEVANGDFSVYLPPMNPSDKTDYLDVLIHSFNEMVEALGSTETLKTEFLSNVSHEIKTPIAAIMNMAELLRNEELPAARRQEYVEAIIRASKRLSTLITDILRLNKLERQTIVPQPEPYDLCAQLCACALQFEDVWEKRGIEFEAELEDRALVRLDESLMELVWNNLLSNAFKFTGPGGTVSVRQRTGEDGVTVRVSDTGCGMAEPVRRRIFDKFYQGDTSHAAEGNGLGLALVKRVLDMMDCTVTVDSAPGEGTTFAVFIPAKWRAEGGSL